MKIEGKLWDLLLNIRVRVCVQPMMCVNPMCTNKSKWTLRVEDSHFVDWQRVRLQVRGRGGFLLNAFL